MKRRPKPLDETTHLPVGEYVEPYRYMADETLEVEATVRNDDESNLDPEHDLNTSIEDHYRLLIEARSVDPSRDMNEIAPLLFLSL